MKVMHDSLNVVVERWDDPGDYPSNAGSGPLPSYDCLVGVDGTIIVELDFDEYKELWDMGTDDWATQNIKLPYNVTPLTWHLDNFTMLKKPLFARVELSVVEIDPNSGDFPEDNRDDENE